MNLQKKLKPYYSVFLLNFQKILFGIVFMGFSLAQAAPEKIQIYHGTFRGDYTRQGINIGSLPKSPKLKWRYPEKPMCGQSSVGKKNKMWCGTGWTGQPLTYKNSQDQDVVAFGAFDYGIHFLNALSGKTLYPTFYTKDIIKGTGTLESSGLLSIGSRDNKLRILILGKDKVEQTWAFDGNIVGGIWNNDWDGSPAFYKNYLIIGGENGWFFIFKLNKQEINGELTINPVEIVRIPSFNEELIKKVNDHNMSIENSVTIFKNRVYFANSGGMILGYDIEKLIQQPEQVEEALVFKFWAGDDIDATMGVDEEGMLYVGMEMDRFSKTYVNSKRRAQKVGQIFKLNPYKWDPKDQETSLEVLEWSIHLPLDSKTKLGGVWASPAITKNTVYVSTHTGSLLAIDKLSGEILWKDDVDIHAWSSPVVVDDGEHQQLLVANCKGELRNYSLKGKTPQLEWKFEIPGSPCIESTPTVLNGIIYVGTRDGYFYAIGN